MSTYLEYWGVENIEHHLVLTLIEKNFDLLGLRFKILLWTMNSIIKIHAIN